MSISEPNVDNIESQNMLHSGSCPSCGGAMSLSGQVGNQTQYRCRNCGQTSNGPSSPLSPGNHSAS
jgi:tRNA(Ile2) C34 agmatinyltransferase TiaS